MENNQLVQVCTSDSIYLHGYYAPTSDKKTILLHIHGLSENFYKNNFVRYLSQELSKDNISFLTVNTRGNGSNTEFDTKEGKAICIGGKKELLEEAHLDITAWIEFILSENYDNIILSGHSLGTFKVVRYLFEGKYASKIKKLILLAPFDMKYNAEIHNAKEWLSPNTYNSWMSGDDFSKMFEFCDSKYDYPILNKINIPVKIIVGEKDEHFYPSNSEHPEEAVNILSKNIKNSEVVIIPNASHFFEPHTDILKNEIINFIN